MRLPPLALALARLPLALLPGGGLAAARMRACSTAPHHPQRSVVGSSRAAGAASGAAAAAAAAVAATAVRAAPQRGALLAPGMGRRLSSSCCPLLPHSSLAARRGVRALASGASSSAESANADAAARVLRWRHVQGIGKSYERKLLTQGIDSVEQLGEAIVAQLAGGPAGTDDPAVKYLQGLGIRRADHARRIIRHLTSVYAPELHAQLAAGDAAAAAAAAGGPLPRRPDITFCVEGNISAGKSTFLGYITAGNEQLQEELGVVHEPVDQWQCVPTVEGGTLNLLDRFYSDPQRYAYSFQSYVFMSRVMQERKSAGLPRSVRLMERSVFSDRMVFVRAVRESGWMGDVELAVYDSWFGPILESNPFLVPDGFIYLKCDPSTCMQRLKLRGRQEEETISMDYLEGLHAKHEDWLGAGRTAYEPRTRKQQQQQYGLSSGGVLVPQAIQDNLFFLDVGGPGVAKDMHQSLHDVPALVLDCNEDILRDLDLQKEVQGQVQSYIRFMREQRVLKRQQELQMEQHQRRQQRRGGSEAADATRASMAAARARRLSDYGSPQPGGPEGVQEVFVDIAQQAAREENARAPAVSSGELLNAADSSSSSRLMSTASGSLEVLQQANTKSMAMSQ